MTNSIISIQKGQHIDRNDFLRKLVEALYVRNDIDLQRGNFRVKGDTVDIAMAYSNNVLRITWWDDEIETIEEVDSTTFHRLESFEEYHIYPANLFVTSKEQTERAIHEIQNDLVKQIDYFEETVSYTHLSILNTPLLRAAIHDGDIIAMLTRKKGLDTSHVGIAVWYSDGLHLLNASSIRGKVVEESKTLYQYMQGQRTQIGIRAVRCNGM